MSNRDISNTDDVIDVRDVIARIEDLEDQLEAEREMLADHPPTPSTPARQTRIDNIARLHDELSVLIAFMDEMKGCGGDEQWRGDGYPVTAVRDSYFQTYAQELAEDCCPFPRNSPEMRALEMWPHRCIDWSQAARELQMDYTGVDFAGVTYWVR